MDSGSRSYSNSCAARPTGARGTRTHEWGACCERQAIDADRPMDSPAPRAVAHIGRHFGGPRVADVSVDVRGLEDL